jgi:hypothetical protein
MYGSYRVGMTPYYYSSLVGPRLVHAAANDKALVVTAKYYSTGSEALRSATLISVHTIFACKQACKQHIHQQHNAFTSGPRD